MAGSSGRQAGQERDGGPMNIAVRQVAADQRLKIVDCDIHPVYRTTAELHPFMSARWREHMATFGTHFRHGLHGQLPYPRMMAAGMRMDSFPEDGPPGSDLIAPIAFTSWARQAMRTRSACRSRLISRLPTTTASVRS